MMSCQARYRQGGSKQALNAGRSGRLVHAQIFQCCTSCNNIMSISLLRMQDCPLSAARKRILLVLLLLLSPAKHSLRMQPDTLLSVSAHLHAHAVQRQRCMITFRDQQTRQSKQLPQTLQRMLWRAAAQMACEGRQRLWPLPQQLQPPLHSARSAGRTCTGCSASLSGSIFQKGARAWTFPAGLCSASLLTDATRNVNLSKSFRRSVGGVTAESQAVAAVSSLVQLTAQIIAECSQINSDF